MPGFLESNLKQGFDYLDPYCRQYVEKARNAVPLIDQAARRAEELVPPLITRADELAEPRIEKMRPYVEPRIEQVKEKVAPYVDQGVKRYGVIREGGAKYYNAGLEKVEQIKEFKDVKASQIKDVKATFKDFIQSDGKASQIKDFTEAQATPLLGKSAVLLERAEVIIDGRLPLAKDSKNLKPLLSKDPSDKKYAGMSESGRNSARIKSSLSHIKSQLVFAYTVYLQMLCSLTQSIKKECMNGTIKEKACKCITDMKNLLISKVECAKSEGKKLLVAWNETVVALKKESLKSISLKIKNKTKLAACQLKEVAMLKVEVLSQTSLFKKASQMVTTLAEKLIGKDKTAAALKKLRLESVFPQSSGCTTELRKEPSINAGLRNRTQ